MSAPIRLATADDAVAVAALHARAIHEGFLATLGPRFLTRLYRRMVRSEVAFVLVAPGADHGAPDGFVAVAHDTGRFYRDFLRHDAVPAALAAAPRVLRAPRHVWETLRYGTGGEAADMPEAEILAVAVAEHAQGRGVGGALVARALATLHQHGIDTAHVVTAVGNEPALHMYERAGFRRYRRTEVHRGVPQEALVWP
jgi:ribosomal protein S18 acetylase RimI-like enzyme